MSGRALSGFTALTSAHSPLRKGERIVFLGDSLTAAGTGPKGYITMLEEELYRKRPDLDVHLIGAGIGGQSHAGIGKSHRGTKRSVRPEPQR